jgi:hypothetical protein
MATDRKTGIYDIFTFFENTFRQTRISALKTLTKSNRQARQEIFTESVLDNCLGATCSARPARREWLLRQL